MGKASRGNQTIWETRSLKTWCVYIEIIFHPFIRVLKLLHNSTALHSFLFVDIECNLCSIFLLHLLKERKEVFLYNLTKILANF